jgi:dienelactone hydrolase
MEDTNKENPEMRKKTAILANAVYNNGKAPANFTKIKSLSDRRSKVYQDETGKTFVSFRGTDPSRMGDLFADGYIALGMQNRSGRFKEAEQKMKKVAKKFPTSDIYTTGHSLGGGVSNYVASRNKHVKASYAYAPGSNVVLDAQNIGRKDIFAKKKSKAKIHSYSTGVDPISAGALIPKKGVNSHYVPKKKGHGVHDMTNYLEDEPNEPSDSSASFG